MNLELFLNFKGYNLQTIFGIPVRTLQKWLQIIVIVTFLWSCRFLSHLIGVLHVFICYLPPLQIFTCFIYLFCVGTAGLFWRFESLLPMFLLIFNSCVSYGSHFGCLVAHISLNPRTCDSVLQFVIIRHITQTMHVFCASPTRHAHILLMSSNNHEWTRHYWPSILSTQTAGARTQFFSCLSRQTILIGAEGGILWNEALWVNFSKLQVPSWHIHLSLTSWLSIRAS